MAQHQYDRGIPKAFIKGVIKTIQETGTLTQLFECFLKYKPYILDDVVSNAFLDRITFFEESFTSTYDINKAEEFRLDIETERSIIRGPNHKPSTGASEVTLIFNTSSGSLYSDCLRELLKLGIDNFKGQRAAVCSFLGIEEAFFNSTVMKDKELKAYWDRVKKLNKKLGTSL